jgi:hypothetical protein
MDGNLIDMRRKTIFDIMGVVYEYNGFGKQKKAA